MKHKTFAVLCAFISFSSVNAQVLPPDENITLRPNTYGTQDETVITIPAQAFDGDTATTIWNNVSYRRYVSSAPGCCLHAPVVLPAGAMFTGIEIDACDTSTTAAMFAGLATCLPIGCGFVGLINTGDPTATPGCASFRAAPAVPYNVDNASFTHIVEVNNNGDLTGAASVHAVRIYYKLRVSQPPPMPTFSDVPPSHPFYQFIEALVASGITAGCSASPPQYCPDAFLTRGQMAVFLSRALGLHFAP